MVRPGTRRVVFRNGGMTKSDVLEVKPGVADGRKCWFRAPVNVACRPGWAYIVIDGVTTELTTPNAVPLTAGKHTISVEKKGYAASPPRYIVNIDVPRLTKPDAIPAPFELIKK
jgi:hypothetical protein